MINPTRWQNCLHHNVYLSLSNILTQYCTWMILFLLTMITDSPLTSAGARWEHFRHGFMRKIPMEEHDSWVRH